MSQAPPGHCTPAARPGRLAELAAYAALWRYCLAHAGVLRLPPYQRRFLQLFLDGAMKTMAGPGLRAAAVGALALGAAFDALASHGEVAVRMIVVVAVRELGPLLAALIILVRVGSPIAGDIRLMAARGEVRALLLLGLSSRAYAALPALAALTALTLAFTVYFNMALLAGGIGVGALLFGLSPSAMLGQVSLLVTPGDLLYTLCKSAGFGLAIGSVCVHQGLRPGAGPADLPDIQAAGIMQCLSLLLVLNAALAYLSYGPPLLGGT